MLTQNQLAGIQADKKRAAELSKAQTVTELRRRLAGIETEVRNLEQIDEATGVRLRNIQSSFEVAAERFVTRLWTDVGSRRAVRIDLADGDALAFFLRDSILEKLPGLVDRITSKSGTSTPALDAVASLSALHAEAATLRRQLADIGQ